MYTPVNIIVYYQEYISGELCARTRGNHFLFCVDVYKFMFKFIYNYYELAIKVLALHVASQLQEREIQL